MNFQIKKINNEASFLGIGFAIIATFLARGIGFVRELFVAKVFGTSALGDAFIVALQIPDILISGFTLAIATLYIPTFLKVKKENTSLRAQAEFNSSVLWLVVLLGITIIIVVEIFPQFFVSLFAAGFTDQTSNITANMLRIMIVSVVPIFLGGFFKAYGQIVNKYGILTLLGIIINLSIIFALEIWESNSIRMLAYSFVIGNILYALVAFILVKQENFIVSNKIILRNKYLQEMIIGMMPVFMSNIISEVNQIIDKNFASRLMEGTVSALNYSSKIVNLITAVLGTAVSSVLFANLSKLAMEGKKERFANEVIRINSCITAACIPFFYFVLFYARPIIKILFERGNFDSNSVEITVQCLIFYSIGVIGFNIKAIWVRVYNASLDTKTPAINSAIAVWINIILNLLLMPIMQHKGLALATGLSSLLTDFLLILNYRKINMSFDLIKLGKDIIRILISSFIFIPILLIKNYFTSLSLFIEIILIMPVFLTTTILYILLLVRTKTIAGNESMSVMHKIIR